MPDNNIDFQAKVKSAAKPLNIGGIRECYGMSNCAKFVTGGFLCGIPNIENLDESAGALCVFSKIQLSPNTELHTAIVIRNNLEALLVRLKSMAAMAGDFFADKNNNCALFLWADGNVYPYNKAKVTFELTPDILTKIGPGVEPDALYWSVYGNDKDAEGGSVAQLAELIGPAKFIKLAALKDPEAKASSLLSEISLGSLVAEFEAKCKAVIFEKSVYLVQRYAASLLAKPFVILTGNSGTGKSKIATLFAKWLVPEGNTAFVPVGADWTDNRNVLGYANMLKVEEREVEGEDEKLKAPVFQGTEVVKLLFRASEDWQDGANTTAKPWFLILDEMNLSHVERYFSDFLAHLESPGEAIRLHHEEKCLLFLDGPGAGKWVRLPQTLKLPPNLFVVGTVNVDETTYMFSPKVLDRANVIEFKTSRTALGKAQSRTVEGESGNIPAGLSSAEGFLDIAIRARNLAGKSLPDPTLTADKTDSEGKTPWERYKESILEVFEILQRRSQEFGFRVQKEMLAYARVDYHLHVSEGGKGHADFIPDKATAKSPQPWDWQRCFDEQLMQKVLPKIAGNQKKAGRILDELEKFCIVKLEAAKWEKKNEETPPPQPAERNLSYAKIFQMKRRLEDERFTGYL
jgi:hypothetical protein